MKPNLTAHWTAILCALSRLRARAPASGSHESCPASPPRPSAGRCSSYGAPFCQNLCQTGCLGVRDVVGGPRHTYPLTGSALLGFMAFAGAEERGKREGLYLGGHGGCDGRDAPAGRLIQSPSPQCRCSCRPQEHVDRCLSVKIFCQIARFCSPIVVGRIFQVSPRNLSILARSVSALRGLVVCNWRTSSAHAVNASSAVACSPRWTTSCLTLPFSR